MRSRILRHQVCRGVRDDDCWNAISQPIEFEANISENSDYSIPARLREFARRNNIFSWLAVMRLCALNMSNCMNIAVTCRAGGLRGRKCWMMSRSIQSRQAETSKLEIYVQSRTNLTAEQKSKRNTTYRCRQTDFVDHSPFTCKTTI